MQISQSNEHIYIKQDFFQRINCVKERDLLHTKADIFYIQ